MCTFPSTTAIKANEKIAEELHSTAHKDMKDADWAYNDKNK